HGVIGSAAGTAAASEIIREYNVSAIHVLMPLNKFGDHDPEAYMYVLDKNIPRVRDQEKKFRDAVAKGARFDCVTTGLREDPIQPLVIRANMGETLIIHFTNQLTDGPASLQLYGLPFKLTKETSGSTVQLDSHAEAQAGTTISYTVHIPSDDPRIEHGYYFHDGGYLRSGSRNRVSHGLFGMMVVEPAGSTYFDPEITGMEVGEITTD